jgi:membrane protein YdbS with pleckstrin-like domain
LFKNRNYGIIRKFKVYGSKFKILMFCIKCGTENPDDAVYCKKCGGMLEAEEETRVAARGGSEIEALDEHHEIFRIGPTLKFVYIGYVAAIIGALFLVALLAAIAAIVAIPTGIAVILGLALLLIPAYYHFRNKLISYRLMDTTIEIDTGLISRTTRNVPLRRIQDVTVSATMMQRMLGFGDIIIDNASEDGGKVVLDNINNPREYADILLKQMRRLDR